MAVALGGERVTLRIVVVTHRDIKAPIICFILMNGKAIVLLGDNTLNSHVVIQLPAIQVGCYLLG